MTLAIRALYSREKTVALTNRIAHMAVARMR